jgi:hypothetical protein
MRLPRSRLPPARRALAGESLGSPAEVVRRAGGQVARNDKRKGARNDSGVEKELATTWEVTATVKNAGKTRYMLLNKLRVIVLQPGCYRFMQRFWLSNRLPHCYSQRLNTELLRN